MYKSVAGSVLLATALLNPAEPRGAERSEVHADRVQLVWSLYAPNGLDPRMEMNRIGESNCGSVFPVGFIPLRKEVITELKRPSGLHPHSPPPRTRSQSITWLEVDPAGIFREVIAVQGGLGATAVSGWRRTLVFVTHNAAVGPLKSDHISVIQVPPSRVALDWIVCPSGRTAVIGFDRGQGWGSLIVDVARNRLLRELEGVVERDLAVSRNRGAGIQVTEDRKSGIVVFDEMGETLRLGPVYPEDMSIAYPEISGDGTSVFFQRGPELRGFDVETGSEFPLAVGSVSRAWFSPDARFLLIYFGKSLSLFDLMDPRNPHLKWRLDDKRLATFQRGAVSEHDRYVAYHVDTPVRKTTEGFVSHFELVVVGEDGVEVWANRSVRDRVWGLAWVADSWLFEGLRYPDQLDDMIGEAANTTGRVNLYSVCGGGHDERERH